MKYCVFSKQEIVNNRYLFKFPCTSLLNLSTFMHRTLDRMAFGIGLCVITLMTTPLSAEAATQQQLDDARTKGLAWLVSHQARDGSWNDAVGLTDLTTAMALTAITRSGLVNNYTSSAAATYLSNRPLYSTDAIARSASALIKEKVDTTPQTAQLLGQRSDINGKVWGSYKGSYPTTVDTALALEAFYETGTTYASADTTAALTYLSGNVQADGGVQYVRGDRDPQSHVIPTATTLRVWAKYRPNWALDTQLNGAVNWLVGKQRTDGGYSEDASATQSNLFDSALVYAALAQARALNISGSAALNATTTTAFNKLADYLVAQRSADGSWGGSALVTAAVMSAWTSTTLTDTDKDGMPDVVENALGTNPTVVDTRYLAKGNGLGVQGTNYAAEVNGLTAGQSLSKQLTAPAGVTPVSWWLVSGSLPAGVALSNSGLLSGVPGAGGVYNFVYGVTASDGRQFQLVSQLNITVPDTFYNSTDDDVPTLPEWAAILCGLLLCGLAYRRTTTSQWQA